MLIKQVQNWFRANNITDAVVGYSGGIDSTVTALVLDAAGIKVHLVVAEAPNQKYSSPLGGAWGAEQIHQRFELQSCKAYSFEYPVATQPTNVSAANEAALPILRNAVFYARAAELRAEGRAVVVAGTANFSEAAFLGFWGKASDGAQDVYPITHLSKAEVYDVAREFKVPNAIMEATPSGDLLFEDTNDFKMIGATYSEIQNIIDVVEDDVCDYQTVFNTVAAVANPKLLADNILRNRFKYLLPFPGFHVDDRLERFRKYYYNDILTAAKEIANA